MGLYLLLFLFAVQLQCLLALKEIVVSQVYEHFLSDT